MVWRPGLLMSVAAALVLKGQVLKGDVLPIRAYSAADGLAADRVTCSLPDTRGFLWFCTPEGLSRFDGYRFVNFAMSEGLPHRVVEAVLETRSGDMLVGTARGLSRFHPGAGNKLSVYLPGGDRLENHITALRQGLSGRIWCGTANGLFEVTRDFGFRRQPLPLTAGWDRVTVTDIVELPGGELWIATPDGIDVVEKDGSLRRIGTSEGLPNPWVNSLLRDREGRIWAATRGGLALMRRGTSAGRYGVERTFFDSRGSRDIAALVEAPDGALWLGTSNGILRLPAGGETRSELQRFDKANGLTDYEILSLSCDRAGNLWIGTEGAGVMKIAPAGFTTFSEPDGLASDRVWSVVVDRAGTLLAVTVPIAEKGKASVNVYDGEKFHAAVPGVYGESNNWGSDQILLQSRTGEWWVATKKGLCRFDRMRAVELDGKQPRACYASDSQVFKTFEDSRGIIWASLQSSHGDRLMQWNARGNTGRNTFLPFEEGPSHNPRLVWAFAEDRQGNVWMGMGNGNGLYRYDGQRFTHFGEREGVPAGAITALLTDHAGRLWIGSRNGLAVIDNPGGEHFGLRRYTTENGLASNNIQCLVEDREGRLYAGSGRGIDRLDPATDRIKHYSTADGLAHGEMESAARDTSGNLWFATTQGLSRLTPGADSKPTAPSVRITDLRVGPDRYPVSQAGEALISNLRVQPSFNQIQVQFAGFNNEPEERLRYKYTLYDGKQSLWHGPERNHDLNYPGLPAGSYRLLIKAVNSEGEESTTSAEVAFTVLPPFYRRWWFEMLVAASSLSLIWAAHRYRVAQAVNLERMRTAIATDLHDDIGASLSQIAILSEVVRLERPLESSTPNARLDRMAALAREVADSMSDIVWAIRSEPEGAEQEGMDALIRRLREVASDLLESQSIQFEFRVQRNNPNVRLSLQARRNIYLIFKECIHNVARHSGCSVASAEFQVASEISLRVVDNGRGLDNGRGCNVGPSRAGGGNGIPNMRRRVENLGGRIEWTTTPGGGCTAEVHLPLRRSVVGKSRL